MSIRNAVRYGSGLSIMGMAIIGSVKSMSVINFAHLGSTFSIRSMARFGSSLSA